MKKVLKFKHPYSVKEFAVNGNGLTNETMFVINLLNSRAGIEWIESTWRSDLDELKEVEMFYSKQSCLGEDGSVNEVFSFENIEQSEHSEFDIVVLISRRERSSFGSRVARMIADEILSNYALVSAKDGAVYK